MITDQISSQKSSGMPAHLAVARHRALSDASSASGIWPKATWTGKSVRGVAMGVAILAGPSLSISGWTAERLETAPSTIASEGKRPAAFAAARAEVQALVARPVGWDGDGGVAPGPDAIDDALAFLDQVANMSRLAQPEVYAPGDGEVTFQWRRGGAFIEVAFAGDEVISWSARSPNGAVVHDDDPFDRSIPALPAGLAEALTRLA